MIFGYTEDKNKVEVPSMEYLNECLSDTGWVTICEARTNYNGFEFIYPVKYRKIGNVVYIKGATSDIYSDVATNEVSGQIATLSRDYWPPEPVMIPLSVNYKNGMRFLELTVGSTGELEMKCFSESAFTETVYVHSFMASYLVN